MNWAKFLVDSPAGYMAPKELARQVQARLDDDEHVSVEIWTEPRIREERLGGLLGVGEGSAQPTRLVYATYDPSPDVELPHIALVGKGVTFDSGGLSLKTGVGMMTMKTDMTGAAIVMAALSIASRLELAVKVTAIAPMTENLPSDRATKPGDVLTIRNGMTIEVLNTDAEGRLILADGLILAVEANPDAIVDVATLTGAQVVALGDEVGAIFASTDELADYFARRERPQRRTVLANAAATELRVAHRVRRGRHEEHGQDRRGWHRSSAALILQRFTDGRPWAHLDIAGPARADTDRGYATKGATAFSARTIVEFLEAVARRTPTATSKRLTSPSASTRVTSATTLRARRGRARLTSAGLRPSPRPSSTVTRKVFARRYAAHWRISPFRVRKLPHSVACHPLSSMSSSNAIVAMAASVCQ